MKLALSLTLLLAAHSVGAQSSRPPPPRPQPFVGSMHAECERQMKMGICFAQIDRATYPAGEPVLIPGKGRVNLDAYIRVRNAGDRMCLLSLAYCSTSPNGDECKTALAMWGM